MVPKILATFAWKYSEQLGKISEDVFRFVLIPYLHDFFEDFSNNPKGDYFPNPKFFIHNPPYLLKKNNNMEMAVKKEGSTYFLNRGTSSLKGTNIWQTLSLKKKLKAPFILDFKVRIPRCTVGYECKFTVCQDLILRFNKTKMKYEGYSPWGFFDLACSSIKIGDKKWTKTRIIVNKKNEVTLKENNKVLIHQKPFFEINTNCKHKKIFTRDKWDLCFHFQIYDRNQASEIDITDIGYSKV